MSWASGSACYSWDYNRCESDEPEQTFAISNTNYGTTKFSYYTQLWCMGKDWDFGGDKDGDAAAEWSGDDSDDRRDRGSDSDRRDSRSRLVMEQYEDGTMRLEMVMGATKLAATAATAVLATSLY